MFHYLTSGFVPFVVLSNTWFCCFCIFIVLKCRDLVLQLNYSLISLKFKPNSKSNGPNFKIFDISSPPPIFVCCTYCLCLWHNIWHTWFSISQFCYVKQIWKYFAFIVTYCSIIIPDLVFLFPKRFHYLVFKMCGLSIILPIHSWNVSCELNEISKCLLVLCLIIISCFYQLRGVLDTTLCDKVCQWLAAGRWFPWVPPASSTDCHDIAEILLKVALNTLTLSNNHKQQTNS
jgi:hypothetical protein